MQSVDNGDTVQDKSRDVRCISGDHQLLSAKQISSNIFRSQFADWGVGGTFGIGRCCLGGLALHKQEEGNKLDKTNA